MSVKLTHIDMKRGDNVFLQLNGSPEVSISVRVTASGKFVVSGPMNINGHAYQITDMGMKRISKSASIE